ncbi:hypothetical protein [Cupriavidus nantongensis]|nr:hypothetical protein [Cupriavidus nantongensis]
MSQEQLGEVGGVKRLAQMRYESDERSPDAVYLAAIGGIGVDVLYVLTGNRTPAATITAEERALLDNYKHAGAEGQAAARKVLDALAQPKEMGKKVG